MRNGISTAEELLSECLRGPSYKVMECNYGKHATLNFQSPSRFHRMCGILVKRVDACNRLLGRSDQAMAPRVSSV
jgi:hypothetical protein